MEISERDFEHLRRLRHEVECPYGFICLEQGFQKAGKVRDMGMDSYVQCLQEQADDCPMRFCFGYSYFCKCKIRVYAAKNLQAPTKRDNIM